MKYNKSRLILLGSQIVVVLVFFTGMLLNYVILFPILDEGEGARMAAEIDNFCSSLYPDWGCDYSDEAQMDSLLKLDPYREGDIVIMDADANILYSKDGSVGCGYDLVESKYGEKAVRLLNMELNAIDNKSLMDYDRSDMVSLYASYRYNKNLLFFYAIDYHIAGSKLYEKLMRLLFFMVFGGITLIIISFILIKKITSQVRKDFSIQKDLDTTALIQKAMLPQGEKHLIQLDANARLVPAKKVAGDFYSYLLRDGLLYFCIGDVSGKGLPASMFMSKAVTLFRSYASSGLSAGEIATNMNQELCANNVQNMFITAIVGVMRAYDGKITYVNAGHELPVIWNGRDDSKVDFLQCEGDVPLGVLSDVEYKEETYEMEKNGLLMLYTDGISEAKSRHQGLLGRERLLQVMDGIKNLPSVEINDHLLAFISDFESGIEQSDDITLLTFRNFATPKRLVLKNEIQELRKISPFMEDIFKECYMDRKTRVLVRSGLDEALTNCVHYAYDSPGNEIEVTASVDESRLYFTIKDSGKAFNPLEYNPEPSDEIKIGGLGISMYKSSFDEVQYSRENGYNVLKLIKNL